jgi:hypothetical protein
MMQAAGSYDHLPCAENGWVARYFQGPILYDRRDAVAANKSGG